MPSKRKGSSVASVTSEDDEDYRTKRDRNNQVRKYEICWFDNKILTKVII